MVNLDRLQCTFRERYGTEPRLFRAPGRVNLIGEHTDYNGGFVLPMAVDRETVVAASARDDRQVRAFSLELDSAVDFDLDHPGQRQRGLWLDYVEGVAQALEARGVRLRGADLLLDSNVPIGAGLSSSAALELAVGLALTSIAQAQVEEIALALAGQQAEHEYVGIKCGIMDQFTAALARVGHALLIDCRTLETKYIPLNSSRAYVAICDTHVKHALASSEYNTRRAQCECGVELLRGVLPDIRALRDVSVVDFQTFGHLLAESIKRRCRHVITENARVLAAADALSTGDLETMGELMFLSHDSMRDDFEASCTELDLLVDIARSIKGVIGARMTGGGFGGCTVNLVSCDALEEFQAVVSRRYKKVTNIDMAIYISEASDGAKEIGRECQA
ncbi:MAG TPA: galactokinase [Gammaproteobacteria bacterium]|nr:galactokinase [Gammaproteobacteria bacterium]